MERGVQDAGIYSMVMGTGAEPCLNLQHFHGHSGSKCSVFMSRGAQMLEFTAVSSILELKMLDGGLKMPEFSASLWAPGVKEQTESSTLQAPGAFLHASCPSHWHPTMVTPFVGNKALEICRKEVSSEYCLAFPMVHGTKITLSKKRSNRM